MTHPKRMRLPRVRQRNRRVSSRGGLSEGGRTLGASVLVTATWVLGLSAFAAATYGAYEGWQAAVSSRRFALKEIQLAGNHRASVAELSAYTGAKPGDGLLDLDLDAIALRLRRHPWVDSARVRRRLPDELIIDVQEHTPALLVSLGDVYVASSEGRLFKRVAAEDGLELPVLTGLSRDTATRQPLDTAALVLDAIALHEAFVARDRQSRLDELHHDRDLGWSLVVSPQANETLAYRMHLGLEPRSRVDAALAAVARVRELGERPLVVFADGKKSPNRVQVRLRSSHDAARSPTFVASAK